MAGTEQEIFWMGEFGDAYTERNQGDQMLASNIAIFADILGGTRELKSVLEFGPNRGMNLLALHNLLPDAEISGVEINHTAVGELQRFPWIKVYHKSILDFRPDYQRDLVLSKGLMIHINPDELTQAYAALYESSCRYICLVEYYNPSPVELRYRGFEGKLFKRDFAGEMMDIYADLHLCDYGFVYHRDNIFPQDDLNWFLLEKGKGEG